MADYEPPSQRNVPGFWDDAEAPRSELIEGFLDQIDEERSEWQLLLDTGKSILEGKKEETKVPGLVTARLKSRKSLRDKLYLNLPEIKYATARNILDDRLDFAGLRIALYFPDDQVEMLNMIDDIYTMVEKISFEDGKTQKAVSKPGETALTQNDLDKKYVNNYVRRFGGYTC